MYGAVPAPLVFRATIPSVSPLLVPVGHWAYVVAKPSRVNDVHELLTSSPKHAVTS